MFDLVIVGGGMVGATLACALADSNLQVAIVEGNAQILGGEFGNDGRSSSISWCSVQLWQRLGVWAGMVQRGVSPIRQIRVTDGDYPLAVCLDSREMQTEALGYVVENTVSQPAIWAKINHSPNIKPIWGQLVGVETLPDHLTAEIKVPDRNETYKIPTKLLVGADGAKSLVRQLAELPSRQKFYDQVCLVLKIKLGNSHRQVAYEWFQPSGPFALLPLTGERMGVVWTVPLGQAREFLALPLGEFLGRLEQKLGGELLAQFGRISLACQRLWHYQPQWQYSYQYCKERLVLVGDAAHTTSPVAGQGFNLGIRDAYTLAQVLKQAIAQGEDIGNLRVLKRYQRQRYWDNLATISTTDATNLLFSNQVWLWQGVRRTGLHLLHNVLPLRQGLMFLGMGKHYFSA
ncbi:MAG: UbiH/UbiF/VisC/COQ6 family ubiquinone biosynthesis hydroxylase [Pseudanabaenaceae cyanobacterium]